MHIDMAQFHQVFFEESFDGLDAIESGLLGFTPGDPDPEAINAIFRAAHSIKGGAGTFGFSRISDFTHLMETLLGEVREGKRRLDEEASNVLLASVDVLREMLIAARDGGEPDAPRIDAQREALAQILGGAVSSPGAPDPEPIRAGPRLAQASAEQAPSGETPGWKIGFRPHRHLFRTGNDPLRIIRELGELGELEVVCDLDGLPALDALEPEDSHLAWNLVLHAAVPEEEVRDLFEWVEGDCDFSLQPLGEHSMPAGPVEAGVDPQTVQGPVPQNDADAPEGGEGRPQLKMLDRPPERRQDDDRRQEPERRRERAAGANPVGGNSIRVDTGKIDTLINMVGELVITQSMLGVLGEDFSMQKLARLKEGLAQLERHTRELQESVMRIRMLPISFTFGRFPRLVHDLGKQLGKRIELHMSGENTEVDKTVIEKIGDPLVHLIRNSIDHGIERPEERLAAGKPETGHVYLSAEHRAGNIMIEIRDDGRGLGRDRILQRARERGLVSAEDNLNDKQIYDLVFKPGFSTAEEVSDVSGRGVGMDVVQRNINELGGSIEIDSRPGEGSRFTIRLPLTLAILDGQAIRVGDETYIVPLVSIVESIQVEPDMLGQVAGKGETFRLRDEYLPIVRMHAVLDVANPGTTQVEQGILVVVESGGSRWGLFVDDLLGQQQVVVKSLEANYKRIDGLSGATVLGDGSVALILDIPGITRLATQASQEHEPQISLSA